MDKTLDEIRADIETAPIRAPQAGEFVDHCGWSRTGYAVWKGAKGDRAAHCTCDPAEPPRCDGQ